LLTNLISNLKYVILDTRAWTVDQSSKQNRVILLFKYLTLCHVPFCMSKTVGLLYWSFKSEKCWQITVSDTWYFNIGRHGVGSVGCSMGW